MAQDIHMHVGIDEIIVKEGRRELNETEVNKLAKSIKEIGLRHPLTVREERGGDKYILVAGRHRLEAMRRLGNEHVAVVIASMTNLEARMWEISENLHRADLSKQERAEQIAEWIELADEKRKLAAARPLSDSGGRGNESGVRAAARDLNIAKTTAQEAVKIASMTEEAKEAAREAGFEDSHKKLLQVASVPADQQVAKVYELKNLPRGGDGEWRVSFERLWNKASPDDRAWARDFIDRPVMSGSAFG